MSDGLITVLPFGGTPYQVGAPYLYLWNTIPAQTTQTATGLIAGTYICEVTDSNGCQLDVVVTVTQPDSLYLTFNVVDNFCNGYTDGEI